MNLGWLPRFVVVALVVAALIWLGSAAYSYWQGQWGPGHYTEPATTIGFVVAGLGVFFGTRRRSLAGVANDWATNTDPAPRPPLFFSLAAGGLLALLLGLLLRYVFLVE
jgi:hypothetical protein